MWEALNLDDVLDSPIVSVTGKRSLVRFRLVNQHGLREDVDDATASINHATALVETGQGVEFGCIGDFNGGGWVGGSLS